MLKCIWQKKSIATSIPLTEIMRRIFLRKICLFRPPLADPHIHVDAVEYIVPCFKSDTVAHDYKHDQNM